MGAAFESKDLDCVLALYTHVVIFHSPLVARLSHDPSGTVQGKAALRGQEYLLMADSIVT